MAEFNGGDKQLNLSDINLIQHSPRRNRVDFETSVEESLGGTEEGVAFRWEGSNLFGDSVALVFENRPNDTVVGPHGLIEISQNGETDAIEVNIGGLVDRSERTLDFGEPNQIPALIGVLARALEYGMPAAAIIEAMIVVNRQSLGRDRVMFNTDDALERRKIYFDAKREELARKLAERLFL